MQTQSLVAGLRNHRRTCFDLGILTWLITGSTLRIHPQKQKPWSSVRIVPPNDRRCNLTVVQLATHMAKISHIPREDQTPDAKPARFVGIAGLPQSGKDTAARVLCLAKFGGYRYAFADPIDPHAKCRLPDRLSVAKSGLLSKERPPLWLVIKFRVGFSAIARHQSAGRSHGWTKIYGLRWPEAERIRNGPGMVIPDCSFSERSSVHARAPPRVLFVHGHVLGSITPHAHRGDTPLARAD